VLLRQLLLVPLLMEWVLLITLVTPAVLAGRIWFRRNPRLAIAMWLGSFLSAGLAAAASFVISAWVAFGFWLAMNEQPLGSTNWLAALGISFLPWIFLAFGGIALALTNIKFAPQINKAREIHDSLNRGLKVTSSFAGYPVAIVDLPVKVAFTVKLNGAQTIVLGRGVLASLSSTQVEAVMWHEVGHIRGGHNRLKRIAAFAYSAAPFVRASLLMGQEVELLCEAEANDFALRHVSIDDLTAAQRVFSF